MELSVIPARTLGRGESVRECYTSPEVTGMAAGRDPE